MEGGGFSLATRGLTCCFILQLRLLQALLSASLGPGGGLPWRLWATGAKPQSLVAGELAEDTAPEGGLQAGGSVQVLHRQQSGGFHRSCPPGAEVRLHRLAA